MEAARMRRKREEARSTQEKVKKMKEIIGVTSRWLSRIARDDQEKEQEQEGSRDTRVAQIHKVYINLSLVMFLYLVCFVYANFI